MTASGPILSRIGLAQYIDVFVDEGFETWETVLDITESDLDALGVKLGHRRRLQREISNTRGSNLEKDLRSPAKPSPHEDDRHRGVDDIPHYNATEGKTLGGSAGKRKYRRYPKPDENAPERSPSAYVIFSNKTREELRPQNLSFTGIAKRVGESWQILAPEHKEPYESQASAAKEKYHTKLMVYKKTDQYRDYAEYLAEFKLKNASNADGKRPKLEKDLSASAASSESAGSQHDPGVPFSTNTVVGRHRFSSVGSMGTLSTSIPSRHPSPGDLVNATPIAVIGGPNTVLGTPTPAFLPPASSSGGRKESLQASPRFQSSKESLEDNLQGAYLPRLTSIDSKNTRVRPGSTTTSSDSAMIIGRDSPPGNIWRSDRVVHTSLLQQDTVSSMSSRSSNLSSEESGDSSIYKSVDDTKPQRSLPSLSSVGLKPTGSLPYAESGGQSHYTSHSDQSASTYGPTLHSPFGSSSSSTLESLQLPLPYNISFQNDQPSPRDLAANSERVDQDIPQEKKSLRDLALTSISPDAGEDLRNHPRDSADARRPPHIPALQDSPVVSAEPFQNGHPTPSERLLNGHYAPLDRFSRPYPSNDDYRTQSFSVSNSNPLSVLAHAVRIVDEDARLRSPKRRRGVSFPAFT